MTALRFIAAQGSSLPAPEEVDSALRKALDPARAGITAVAVREEGAASSRGAINFGEYFVYFSFFIVVSALLLTGLFFKLGVEQRLREIGLLEAVGFRAAKVRTIFLLEGALLAAFGCVLGLAGALAYGKLMIYGLTNWWVGAVGTTALELHISLNSLAAGGIGGFFTALISIWLTLWTLRHASPRGLLHGVAERQDGGLESVPTNAKRVRNVGIAVAALAVVLVGAAAAKAVPQVSSFFGAGSLVLASMICFAWAWMAGNDRRPIVERDSQHTGHKDTERTEKKEHTLGWLGMRNAAWRPGRSLLCIALVASATFILVAVDAFHRGGGAPLGPKSGTGGFPLLAESLVSVPYDLNTPEGKRNVNLGEDEIAVLDGVNFINLRVRPGDDASCLNLYQPRNPKIIGVPESLIAANRFTFSGFAANTLAEKENPWRALEAESADGTIPAIGDANSLQYVLNLKIGDTFEITRATDPSTGKPVRLKVVGALADSIFQSELLIAGKHFTRIFPYVQGFRAFLIEAPPARATAATQTLESALSDFGFDVSSAGERLASFHRVENTYLSTFQALGGLGLLLGTLGLAAVLLRNVFERRRELALLRAVGYRQADLALLVIAENAILLAIGLFAGVLAAGVAIAPAIAERGGALPLVSVVTLLAGVLLTGFAASFVAVAAVVRAPLLAALRSE
jgi:ABC-type antimicrobial peptide transport system permease subunit